MARPPAGQDNGTHFQPRCRYLRALRAGAGPLDAAARRARHYLRRPRDGFSFALCRGQGTALLQGATRAVGSRLHRESDLRMTLHRLSQSLKIAARTAAQVLVDQLVIQGVRHVFCVPGESYLSVLDALVDRDIVVTVCRNEGGAAMMAEAHGKATGRPG